MKVHCLEEAGRCLLCNDAPCGKVCGRIDVPDLVRSLRFGNAEGAAARIEHPAACCGCTDPVCTRACTRGRLDRAVDIPSLVKWTSDRRWEGMPGTLPDPGVEFCGFRCENPFILASSVVSSSYLMCRRAFEAGWAGASVKTVCYLDIRETSPRYDVPFRDEHPFTGFKNLEQLSPNTPEFDFGWISRLKREFPSKLVIASIMGRDAGEWERLSAMADEAGADVVECNFSCPQMVGRDLGSDIGQDPEAVERYVRACVRGTSIPVIAKLTPNLEGAEGFVAAAYRGGASGISGINTVKSLATVDFTGEYADSGIDGRTSVSGLSGRAVKPIALRFVRDMYRSAPVTSPQISGIGGIETWRDAVDFMLMGASNVQVCTAVMQYGIRIIDDLVEGIRIYMARSGVTDLGEIVGKGLRDIVEPEELDRETRVLPAFDLDRCVACGRCYIACRDGGHQAIELNGRRPALNAERCTGCHLCRLVCPSGAVGVQDRVPVPS